MAEETIRQIAGIAAIVAFLGACVCVLCFRKDPFIERVKRAYGEDTDA